MSDEKPDIKNEPITLRVKDQNGTETVFKVKASTKFKRILDAYAQKTGASAESLKLMYDGEQVNTDQTPHDLDIEDNDVLEVVLAQTGGGL